MLEVEPGPELEKELARCACRLHSRRLHDAAGIPAAGTLVESRVVTTVDTQLAKSYLETSFAERPRQDQTKVVQALSAQFDQRTTSWELLRDLTHETSVDFATLYFVRRTAYGPPERPMAEPVCRIGPRAAS
jgi:hypothetical protein